MKTYVAILIGVVVIFSVVFGGYKFIKNSEVKSATENKNQVKMIAFNGNVVRMFEGENKINYTFNIPETASTSMGMDGALIRVTDNEAPYVSIYMSYEGGRGFSPLDYISEIIAPHVSVINPIGTSTIGAYEWQIAESEGSEWHIASVNEGQWLVIIENKKTVHDNAERTIESTRINQ